MNIGWIGCGDMGRAMAEKLIDAGFDVWVYNRTRSKAESLLAEGAKGLYESPKDIAENTDIIFTSLTNIGSLHCVLEGENGIYAAAHCEGKILIDMSTLSPDDSDALGTELKCHGISYLSCPVIGSMFMAQAGKLKVLASGPKDLYEKSEPLLSAIGSCTYYGDSSESRSLKLANNMLICSYLTLYSEILLAGERLKIDWKNLNTFLERSPGSSAMLFDKGTTLLERKFKSPSALVTTACKDLSLAAAHARAHGFSLPLTEEVARIDHAMVTSSEYHDYSTFGTIDLLEKMTGITPSFDDHLACMYDDETTEMLCNALIGLTEVMSREALLFCTEAGIDKDLALASLRSCHGASEYFKSQEKPDFTPVPDGELVCAMRAAHFVLEEFGYQPPFLTTAILSIKG